MLSKKVRKSVTCHQTVPNTLSTTQPTTHIQFLNVNLIGSIMTLLRFSYKKLLGEMYVRESCLFRWIT